MMISLDVDWLQVSYTKATHNSMQIYIVKLTRSSISQKTKSSWLEHVLNQCGGHFFDIL
jgi:hypothetical protein